MPRRNKIHQDNRALTEGAQGQSTSKGGQRKKFLDLIPTDNIENTNKRETPARNTCSQSTSLSIMDEVMLSWCQMSRTSYQIDPQKAASRKYPLKLFCELAGAVLDEETGDLLEYRHLVKHPNQKNVWGGAFVMKVGRLAQGLPGIVEGIDTVNFLFTNEIPSDSFKDVTYARIV